MRKFLTILFSVFSFIAISQNCPYLGPDQILPCGVGSTVLTADLTQCGTGTNPNQTTNYTVSGTAYNPDPYTTGTQITQFYSQFGGVNNDDGISNAIPMPFNFCFFGQIVTSFYISSNNWVGFSAGQPSTWVTTTIPNAGGSTPRNCIMSPWQDINPGNGGTVKWAVYGTAPCRRLVISYYNVPMFSCTSQLYSSQIKIYESTNIIETHILNKPVCGSWNSGNAVHGLHNSTGTTAILVPGRNNTQWSTTNEGTRFTPSGPVVTPTLTWYQVGNPVAIGTGPTITVNPTSPTQYTCHFVYPTCNAGWSSCNAGVAGPGPDTVLVVPGPPNIILNTSFTEPLCFNDCNGTATATPITGTPLYNYLWSNGQTTQTATNLCAGIYNVNVTDINGCSANATVNVTQPTQLIFDSLSLTNVTCSLNDGEIIIYPNGGTPQYSYFLDNVLSNDTITNLAGGNYTVSVTDNNGCSIDSIVYIDFPIPINISISPVDTLLCVPGTFNFINNSSPVVNIVSSTIDYNDGNIDNILSNSNFTHTYSSVGVWDITVTTVNDYGCTYVQTFNNIVETTALPVSQFMVGPNPTTMFETEVFTSDYSGPGIVSWSWSAPGSLEGTSYLSNPNFTYPEGIIGQYLITLTVQNSLGCSDSSSVVLIVNPDVLTYIPNAFTPGDDEFNSSWKFYLSGVDEQDFSIYIFNRWGQMIWECHDINGQWDGSYNGYYVPDGTYVWRSQFKVLNSSEKRIIMGYVTIIR
jgi:gliding motility-associated-like protein